MEVELDIRGIQKMQRKLISDRKDVEEANQNLIRQNGRTVAGELGYYTSPRTFKEPKKARGKIASEINRLYARLDGNLDTQASKLYELLRKVNPKRADAFWAKHQEGDGEAALEIAQKTRGVPKRLNAEEYKGVRGARNSIPIGTETLAAAKSARVEGLIKKQINTIGTAKAGWFQAQKDVGGRTRAKSKKFPKWVTKAGSKTKGDLGGARYFSTLGKVQLELVNKVSYTSEALSEASLHRALDSAEKRFARELEQNWRAINKKSERKTL